MFRSIVMLATTLFAFTALGQTKISFGAPNEDIVKLIETYAKASGQKFVVNPGVRGKVGLFLPEPITVEEAFNQLSSALAVNGFAISQQGDTFVVNSARNIQRNLIEVGTTKPSLKPERMYTWVMSLKNVPVDQINRDLRILASKDGELAVNTTTNQIIMTDWVSNLNRVAAILENVDKKIDPATAKLVESAEKKRRELRQMSNPQKGPSEMEPKSEN